MAISTLVPETDFDPAKEYGKLRIGMEVEVSTDPNGTNPGWGHICGIEGNSIHIWFASADSNQGVRQGVLEDCMLINDPRVKRQPQLINDQERRGVFWMSENQLKFESFAEQILALTETVESLVAKRAILDGDVKALKAQIASHEGI